MAEACQDLSCPPGSDWLVLDSSRLPLPHPPSAQGTVAATSRLGRAVAVELAAVASAATLGATTDSESSGQSAAQRLVRDPFLRSPSVKVTAVPSDSSCERVVSRHRALLLILRVRRGSCTRRFRPHGR